MNEASKRSTPTIRILLAEIKGLMADIVKRAIQLQSDMAIAQEIRSPADLDAVVAGKDFDVVVTSLSGSTIPPHYRRLLFEPPHVPVITISGNGQRAEVYDHKLIREVAPLQLVELIREVAQLRSVS